MQIIMIVPRVVQSFISQFPESSQNAYKYFNYDHRVVEERVQRADQKPLYQGPYDLTNADYGALIVNAKSRVNEILAKYSPRVANEDALHMAIRDFNNGQFDGKISASHFDVLVKAMDAKSPVMAKGKEKTPKPEKEKAIPPRLLKELGVNPRQVPFTMSHPNAPRLVKKPGQGIILKKKKEAAEGGAPNEYVEDFLNFVNQLPTKDFDIVRKFVGRWAQSKELIKKFLQGSIKDAGIDPEYAQAVADDFKISATAMDRLEALYDMISKFDMDKIKTHFEPLLELVEKVKGQSATPEAEPTTNEPPAEETGAPESEEPVPEEEK